MMRPMTRRGLGPPEVHAAQVRNAVSSLVALNTLILSDCNGVTAEGLRAVSSLTALKFLDLTNCPNITSEGLRAVIK